MTTLDIVFITIGLLSLSSVIYFAVRIFGWSWLAGVVLQLVALTVIIAIFLAVLLLVLLGIVQPLLPDKYFFYDHPEFILIILFLSLFGAPALLNRYRRWKRSNKKRPVKRSK